MTDRSRDPLLEAFNRGENMDAYFDFEHPIFPNREPETEQASQAPCDAGEAPTKSEISRDG